MRRFESTRLHGVGEGNLDRLAEEAAARPQEEIARGLHGDRARSAQPAAGLVLLENVGDGVPVDAGVEAEGLVLRRDHGAAQRGRDAVERHRPMLDPSFGDEADHHQGVIGGSAHR